MKKLTIIIVTVFVALCGAYFLAYFQVKSEFKLAELKSDLDGMYKSLNTLSTLKVPSSQDKLDKISKAIVVREQMLLALADHDHELAVRKAGELVGIVPKHTEGIKVLRESGQIFILLRNAIFKVSEALKTEEPTEISFERVSFSVNNDGAEKNIDLVKFIQDGLHELGYYHGVIDGNVGPNTLEAISEFGKKRKIEFSAGVSNETANIIVHELALKQEVREWKEKKFHDINQSREIAQAAVALDPRFERAVNLEKDLERAHEAVALTMSVQVVKSGTVVLSHAASIYDIAISALNSAASSRYGSISVTYSEIEPILKNVKDLLKPLQSNIDQSMSLISTYKGDRSKEYFTVLKHYVQIVQLGVDTFLVPTGNLVQFRQAAEDTLREFKRIHSHLESLLPNSAELEETSTGFIKVFGEYSIFQDPETEKVIDDHKDLYSI